MPSGLSKMDEELQKGLDEFNEALRNLRDVVERINESHNNILKIIIKTLKHD